MVKRQFTMGQVLATNSINAPNKNALHTSKGRFCYLRLSVEG